MESPVVITTAGLHIDDNPTAGTMLAPTIGDIGLRDRGKPFWTPVLHGHAIKVTPVFCGQLADKRRLPEWSKAVRFADGTKAAEEGGDEDEFATFIDGHVVDIEVTGRPGKLRDIDTVVAIIRLAGFERVVETPDLVQGAEVDLILMGTQAHRTIKGSLEDGKATVGLQTDEEELP